MNATRLVRAGAIAAVLAVASVAPASASHDTVLAGVSVMHGERVVAMSYDYFPCTGTSCSVSFQLGHRDYGRFVRWCGSDTMMDEVLAGNATGGASCQSRSTWHVETWEVLYGAGGAVSAETDVEVAVTVAP